MEERVEMENGAVTAKNNNKVNIAARTARVHGDQLWKLVLHRRLNVNEHLVLCLKMTTNEINYFPKSRPPGIEEEDLEPVGNLFEGR